MNGYATFGLCFLSGFIARSLGIGKISFLFAALAGFFGYRRQKNLTKKFSNLYQSPKGSLGWTSEDDCDWLNVFIRKFWRHYQGLIDDFIYKIGQSVLANVKAPGVHAISIKKVTIGTSPPKLYGFRSLETDKPYTYLEFRLAYVGDMHALLHVRSGISKDVSVNFPLEATIRSLSMKVQVKIALGDSFPPSGPVWISLAERPEIDIRFVPLGTVDVFDIPGLSQIITDVAMAQIENLLVFPNHLVVYGNPAKDSNASVPRNPVQGALLVKVIEARDLPCHAFNETAETMCRVRVGKEKKETHVVTTTSSPKWNKDMEFPVDSSSGAGSLRLAVFEETTFTPQGYVEIPIAELPPDETKDMWLSLRDTDRGSVRVEITFRPLKQVPAAAAKAFRGYVKIKLIGAKNLMQTSAELPKPFVTVTCGSSTIESALASKTLNPVWHEVLEVNARDPCLRLIVKDSKARGKEKFLGSVTLDLASLETGKPILYPRELLENVTSGELSFEITVLPTTTSSALLETPEVTQSKPGFSGKLVVKLLNGKDLVNVEEYGESDPYVKLKVGNQTFSSVVKWNSCNPTWNETFVFDNLLEESELVGLVRDKDRVGKDTAMGSFRLPLCDFESGVPKLCQVQLEGVDTGVIELEVTTNPEDEGVVAKLGNQITGLLRFDDRLGVGSAIGSALETVDSAVGQPFNTVGAQKLGSALLTPLDVLDKLAAPAFGFTSFAAPQKQSPVAPSKGRTMSAPIDLGPQALSTNEDATAAEQSAGEGSLEGSYSSQASGPSKGSGLVAVESADMSPSTSFVSRGLDLPGKMVDKTLGFMEKLDAKLMQVTTRPMEAFDKLGDNVTNTFMNPLGVLGKRSTEEVAESAGSTPIDSNRSSFEKHRVSGTLMVQLLEGQNLPNTNPKPKGISDPYVLFRLGDKEQKSKVIKHTLEPRWGEAFEFKHFVHETFLFGHVRDSESFGKDRNMGTFQIELSELTDGAPVERWVDLENSPSGTGRIHLILCFTAEKARPKTWIQSTLKSVIPKSAASSMHPPSNPTNHSAKGVLETKKKATDVAVEQVLGLYHVAASPNTLHKSESAGSASSMSQSRDYDVTVVEARELKDDVTDGDNNTDGETYVVLRNGKHKYMTSTAWGAQNPRWDKTFKLRDIRHGSSTILGEVFQRDIASDQMLSLGGCTVDLENLAVGASSDEWYQLQGRKSAALRLHLLAL